ncbi:adenylate/guanylate cyclase domain-containing protein [Rhodobium gokarnense]|uniref:Adenylate cyclase n=1 Tax=Rhodobium gokarnense TaxID=364296 RepID=A0ABT3HBT3_9HYPH|nr:adenylate/guanylate cyclase domain-containing protein [Rhodobium gokarnense]MCW2307863.1 adenylate cyclase [Rhodobium gokarnense]
MAVLLSVAFGGLVAVTLAAGLTVAVLSNYRNTVSLLDDKAMLLMHAFEDGLRRHLEPSRQSVTRLARLYRDSDLTIGGASMQSILMGALIGRPGVDVILVYGPDLNWSGVVRHTDGTIQRINEQAPLSEKVITKLRSIKADDGTRWTELLYIPSAETVYTSIAAPLERGGRIDGYLVAAISTKRLSELTRELAVAGATAFILDGDGRLIAHSDAATLKLGSFRSYEHPTVDPAKAGDGVLAARGRWEKIDGFPKTQKAGITIAEFDGADENGEARDGPPDIILTSQLAGFGPQDWTIGMYLSGSDISSEIRRLWGSAMIGLASLVAAVLLSFWLARRLARPLARVSLQASRIANLDIEDVDDLPPSRIREIDTTASAFNRMLEGLRAFTVYVPRSLVAKLVKSGMAETTRSREATLTIMFSDIVGFTTLSESLSVQETAALLNRHFEILVACVEAEGGTVDKFLGDGMLAFWGAPDRLESHADAAVRTAIAIGRAVRAENAAAAARGDPVLRLRIGIHTGPVIVGNIGTYDRVNYTIVGDNVNVCQRIEAEGRVLAPGAEVAILASADTLAALSIAPGATFAGSRLLRGRSAPVDLHAIDPATPDTQLRPGAAADHSPGSPAETKSGEAIDLAADRS